MQLDESAKAQLLAIVESAVEQQVNGKDCKSFILAALQYRRESLYGFGRSQSILESMVEELLRQLFQEAIKEVVTVEVRQQIKDKIKALVTADKLFFVAEAASSEFLDRVKQPISGDLIKIRLFDSKDEEDEE